MIQRLDHAQLRARSQARQPPYRTIQKESNRPAISGRGGTKNQSARRRYRQLDIVGKSAVCSQRFWRFGQNYRDEREAAGEILHLSRRDIASIRQLVDSLTGANIRPLRRGLIPKSSRGSTVRSNILRWRKASIGFVPKLRRT